MKISKIETQKKNKKRSTIYIDGQYAFGLANEIVLKFDLHEGDEITDDLIQNVLLEQERQKIRERAFRLLNYRKRSIQEMKNRLLTIGFDSRLVDEVVAGFVRDQLLDDVTFAQAFVNDYTSLRPKGNIFISRELAKKGIPRKVIEATVRTRDESLIAKDFLRDKLSHLKIDDIKDRQKAIRRLLARGFTPGVVYDVIDNNEKR